MTGIYRTALQAPPSKICNLDDVGLNNLMRDLLRAQAHVAGSNDARVNIEVKAADDGCDGWSSTPVRPDTWLGDTETCWQFKAGVAGEPSKLTKEVLKPIPAKTLKAGGRLVVVCSGSTNGPKGEEARLEVLVKAAKAEGLPTDRIEVYGGERLAAWCNDHPAIASSQAGRPEALWRLSEWTNSEDHNVIWQGSESQQNAIDGFRRGLDFAGDLLHLHVCGHYGVGKTRFALELCKGAAWAPFVIYIRQAADLRLGELVASCAADKIVRVVIVVDEVQFEQLLPLRDSISSGGGRIRLVTIGTSASPDPDRIQQHEILPVDVYEAAKVIARWYPSMPSEHAEFAAHFSDGYMRLARLAAATIIRNPRMDIRGMLEENHIRSFLTRMLGTSDRGALYVVAALSSVGWSGESESEGRTIADHLGLDWPKVRRDVEDFDRRFRVAPRGGRLRYISPQPLAIYLALEAWRIHETEMRTLPAKLSETGKDAYYKRVEMLASSAHAGSFAREELDRLFPADLNDARVTRRWHALAPAHPEMAVRKMREELGRRTVQDRLAIAGKARRTIVLGLVALAWDPLNFADAAHGLALLAEAENESCSNNAVGEFLHRFALFLSGSAASYEERIRVLDQLLESESSELRRLAFRALGVAAQRSAFRMHIDPIVRGLPQLQWSPSSHRDYVSAVLTAIDRLRSVIEKGDPALSEVVEPVVGSFAMLLRRDEFRKQVAELFQASGSAFLERRKGLHRRVSEIVHSETRYWKELEPSALAPVESLVRELADESVQGRLHALTGPGAHHEVETDLTSLGEQFRQNPELLRSEWAWLTSGQCLHAWFFGRSLAAEDIDGLMFELLKSPSMGIDPRVMCGYLHRRSELQTPGWLDAQLDELLDETPGLENFVLEATWRLTSTSRGASRIHHILRAKRADPNVVGQLVYGTWDNLGSADLRPMLEELASAPETAWVALQMLREQTSKRPEELEDWADLALRLATNGDLIRSDRNHGYEWSELSKRLVDNHPRAIYAAIVAQQGGREGREHWFLEHELAAIVAQMCVERDPRGTWEETRRFLEPGTTAAYVFTIGFPHGLVDQMEQSAILEWTAEDPVERASLLAHLVALDFSDNSLAAQLIDSYAHIDEVAQAFHSRRVTGWWSGRASAHWLSLANELEDVVRVTRRPGLRKWAASVARSLVERAEHDQVQEEEGELRGR